MTSYTRLLIAIAAVLAVSGIVALTARAQTLPPTSGPLEPSRVVGCRPPGDVPPSVLQNPHFQAQVYQFSERTYPSCTVPKGGLQAALTQLRAVPSSPQHSWRATAAPAKPAAANPTLPDGLGETPWSTIGPVSMNAGSYGIVSGHVEAIAVDPANPSTMYIGADTGGVWKTTDAGGHWSPPADSEVTPVIGALTIDPNNHNTLYAGTGNGIFALDGMGLLKSTDGGSTWASIGGSSFGWVGFRKIVVDPTTSSKILAATDKGLYVSTDGGASWSRPAGLPQIPEWDIALDPTNHNVVYVAAGENFSSNSQAGIYKSSDGGSSWSLLAKGPNGNTATPGGSTHVGLIRLSIAYTAGGPTIYATAEDPTNSTLYGAFKSTDGGSSWTTIANPDPPTVPGAGAQYWYDDVLAVDPNDSTGRTVWVGGINIFKSVDGGATWTRVTDVYGSNPQHLHPDQHVFAFSGSTIYVGNDGGVYSSSDGGTTWPDHNATLDITQFYATATDPAYAPTVIGGAQDNGTSVWPGDTGNLRWRMMFGGDGGDAAIDYTSPTTYYIEYQNLHMFKSTNAGTSWSPIMSGITDLGNACFVGAFRMDASNPQHLIAGTARVYQTTDGGANWAPISGDLTGGGGCVTALAIAPSAPSTTFYASTSHGKVWVTKDGGSSWSDISAGLPSFWRSSLAVDPTNPQIAYITGGWCISNGCVWRTTNGGQSWQDVSGNLPNFNVNAVLVDPLDPSHLYIGTELGAFETTNTGGSWTRLNTGMPGVSINDLNLNRSGTVLTAATYGRGMYQLFRSWMTLSKDTGSAGTTVTATGHGFQAGETVTVNFNGAPVSSAPADGSGNVTATLSVPILAAGTYLVQMVGNTSNRTATHTFIIPASAQYTLAVEGSDQSLYVNHGSGYTFLGGVLIAAPAVVALPDGTDLYIAVSTDHHLWERTDTLGWQPLAGGYCVDNPAATVSGNTLIVACTSWDHGVYYAATTIPGNGLPFITGWTPYWGATNFGPAVAVVNGVPTLFAVGVDNRLYWRTGSQSWTPFPNTWCTGHPAAATSGTISYVACHGGDHALWYAYNAGSGWSGFQSLGGGLIDGPAIAGTPAGPIFCAEGSDTAVYERMLTTGWQYLGGGVLHGVAAAAG